MSGIGSVTTKPAAKAAETKNTAEAKKKADLEKAAAGFEQIMVKNMLATARVAGKGEYADMGVDAMSRAVSAGGGLGLASAIEKAIGQHNHAAAPETTKTKK